MKLTITLLALLVAIVGCAKKEKKARLLSDDEYRKLAWPGPAAGRAEFVSAVELLPDPAKYSGKRVILAGVWKSGFEDSRLDLENAAQDFWIWVEIDWTKVDAPMGDLSGSRESAEASAADGHGRRSRRIVAEGTFYYRKPTSEDGPGGFGHLSGSPGYFLIDRLFRFERLEAEPNQVPEPTAGSVTPAADAPVAPPPPVAHR